MAFAVVKPAPSTVIRIPERLGSGFGADIVVYRFIY
jgi:hypothetical protein